MPGLFFYLGYSGTVAIGGAGCPGCPKDVWLCRRTAGDSHHYLLYHFNQRLAKKGPEGTKLREFQKSNKAVLAQSAKRESGTGNRAPLLYFSRLTKRVDSSRNNFVE